MYQHIVIRSFIVNILRAGQLGVLVKYTSRLEGNNLVSNWMNLNHVSNNKHCKYNCVVLSSFGQTNQLTISIKPISYGNLAAEFGKTKIGNFEAHLTFMIKYLKLHFYSFNAFQINQLIFSQGLGSIPSGTPALNHYWIKL